MQAIFIGRQPILDRKHDLVAYELSFRAGQTAGANAADDVSATANVIVNSYIDLGVQNVLGQQRGFINVSPELLMSDMIHLLPKTQVVLELRATAEITDDVVRRCDELKQAGYLLALDDVTLVNDKIKPLLPIVGMAKVDLRRVKAEMLPYIVDALKPWPLLLVAERVDNAEQATRCMALGFEMFQGYFFARPQIISGKRAEPSKLALLQLLKLSKDDAETADIEREFKHHPTLTYDLLRMVNSVACGLPRKISSLKQGIVVLGRKQLQRWVQLLLYTAGGTDSGTVSPLMQMAATRGKLMELIAGVDRSYDKDYQDRAFMTGILSLLDTMLGVPLPEVIAKLSLADEVKSALLTRHGRLGRLLTLVEKKEENDVEAVYRILDELAFLHLGELTAAEMKAVSWAGRLGETVH
jgi:EAL and modified HD-GYP domain-containing signal transduction protein